MSRNGLNLADLTKELGNLAIAEDTESPNVDGVGKQIFTHQIPHIVRAYATTPELWDHTLLFLGPTAIGKTEAIRQGFADAIAEMNERRAAAGSSPRKLILTELHVSQLGPVDALGVPRERDGRTYWAPPEIWPLADVLEEREHYDTQIATFLAHYQATGELAWELAPLTWYAHFHDEVTNPSTPQVPHQLFPAWCGTNQGRMIGGHRLVRDFMTVLAGNRVEDGTNSINLAASAVSRMCIIEVVPNYNGWLQHYAFTRVQRGGNEVTRIHPLVIAFLNKYPQHFAPQERDHRSPMDPFPTPRAWKFVSDLFYRQEARPMPEDLFRTNVAGRIGVPVTEELFTFLTYYRELPDIDKVLAGIPVPNWPDPNKRPDLMFIITTQLVMKLNKDNARNFMELMCDETRMPAEFSARTMKLLRPAGKLQPLFYEWDPDGMRTWVQKYKHLF